MFSSFFVAVLGLVGEKPWMTVQAQASYVAGSPVPLPLPPGPPDCLLVSYRPLAQDHIFANLLRFVALRALDQRGSPVLWPLSLRFLLSDAPRRARNAREKPRFGQGFHTLRLAIYAEPRPKTQAPKASRRQNP